MITVNTEALQHLLEGLSSGFRPTPRDVLFFAVALAVFVGLLVVLYLFQRRRVARLRRRRSRETFVAVAARQGLTEWEIDTLLALGRAAGEGEQELHRLVTEPWVFNRSSRQYLAGNPAAEADVAALRFKLDFGRFDGTGPIHSTAELEEPGLPMYLREGSRRSGHARLVAARPRALVVRMDSGEEVPGPGEPVQLFFPRSDGIYAFPSRVREVRGPLVQLDHSERVARLQRRRYARCRASFPVRVRPLAPSRPAGTTYLIDLGGGGATLFNPHGNLRERQRLQLELPLPGRNGKGGPTASPTGKIAANRPLKVEGRVVRTSRQGSRIHVEFESVSDPVRDRILGYVLAHETPA